MSNKKVLFVSSEAHPLIKTGGLGDVAGSLPAAIKALKQDIRIIMPAYRQTLRKVEKLQLVSVQMEGVPETVRLFEGRFPGSTVKLWLVDSPAHFDRNGGPYLDELGNDWEDNAERFATFARAVVAVATNQAQLDWQPDVVHCNDWQTGLVPSLLSLHHQRPATVFTVHNLAYHGYYPTEEFQNLDLPHALWGIHGMEFYGGLSYIKGGLTYSDIINTVSPTYAKEILTDHFGYGLEGLLAHRGDRLVGILNGVDYKEWNPATDPHLKHHFDKKETEGKAKNKRALQSHFGLPKKSDTPLLGLVGRLVEQKGIDMVLDIIPHLVESDTQLVVLGTGDKRFEQALNQAAKAYPHNIGVHAGYSEAMAHQIEAGADMFLMPSRFEPCGLNQIYSLRYGTVPIVRKTGGLADTVVDASDDNLAKGIATGFQFEHANSDGLWWATHRAITIYRDQPKQWQKMMLCGMKQDFSWKQSAKHYLELYERALQLRP
ncbi:glycogen synthase GlgA [Pseudomonadota bacterium]